MKHLFILINLISTNTVFAAGDGTSHGGPSDLIAPAVNVAILAGFLIWKLKSPLRSHFYEKSKDIENQMNAAKIKADEANILIRNAEEKIQNLDTEIHEIKNETNHQIATFNSEYQAEISRKKEKLDLDATARIEAEKSASLNALNKELVEKIIEDAKVLVKNDPDKSKQVTSKLLQNLG